MAKTASSIPACRSPNSAKRLGTVAIVRSFAAASSTSSHRIGVDTVASGKPRTEYAAAIGLSGVQYALARGRPVAEQEAVGAALARLRLEAGCVIYTTFDKIRRPLWSDAGDEARATLAEELTLGFETARRVGSRYLVERPQQSFVAGIEHESAGFRRTVDQFGK